MFFPPTMVTFLDEELPSAIPASTYSKIDKYLEGYNSGLNWPDKWEKSRPGGPYVSATQQSLDENRLWLKGWDSGHKEKHRRLKYPIVEIDKLIKDWSEHIL